MRCFGWVPFLRFIFLSRLSWIILFANLLTLFELKILYFSLNYWDEEFSLLYTDLLLSSLFVLVVRITLFSELHSLIFRSVSRFFQYSPTVTDIYICGYGWLVLVHIICKRCDQYILSHGSQTLGPKFEGFFLFVSECEVYLGWQTTHTNSKSLKVVNFSTKFVPL